MGTTTVFALAAEQVLKDDGLVVFGVFGAIEQGGGASGYGLFQKG